MLCISVEEFLIWKKKQLSKGGDQQSFEVLIDCIGGISNSDLNLKILNPKGNLHLKKKLRIFRICLGRSFIQVLPNSISLWNNLLERLKIKSYK
jgi:hypothetical protein